MGGKSSKAKTSVSTKIISDVITNNFSNNSSVVNVNQEICQTGSWNIISDVSQIYVYTIDIESAISSDQVSNMQADIVSQIKQAANEQSQAVLDALNKSQVEVDAEIENEIKNIVTQNNITTMATEINAKQSICQQGEHNIIKNITQSITGLMVLSDVKKLTQGSETITTIDNVLDQEATATSTNPLAVIGDIIGSAGDAVGKVLGIGALGLWAPVLLFIIVVAIIYITGRGHKSPMAGASMASPYLKPTTLQPVSPI